MSASAHQPGSKGDFGGLVLQFAALRDAVWRAVDCADVQLCEVVDHHRRSLRNLHAYLALRATDLRPLQRALDRLGLSSLEHAEAHTLATVDAILANLALLHGHPPDVPELLNTACDFDDGPAQLEQNADRLLGPQVRGRRARIMVTLPNDAAEQPRLLHSLLRTGMDCARINCAYGDQAEWSRTLQALREAEAATGRRCRVFMDLRGPKLRSGPTELEPGVLKIRPLRASDGRVLRPARIWLCASPHSSPGDADACLTLDTGWLAQIRTGDRVRLRDARGSRRKWRIVEHTSEGSWAETRKTTYLVNGTVLRLQRHNDRPEPATTLASLPPVESRIEIRRGDLLYLKYGTEPGEPTARDVDGRLLHPGTIALDVAAVFRGARAGEPIGFDDGRITGVIEEAGNDVLRIRVEHTRRPIERLASDKGVNLPETALDLPALSNEDLRDLEFVAHNADIIGLSFTNSPADVRLLHERLGQLGRQDVSVIFKIETRRGCANLVRILIEGMKFPCFGVMIARGDLAAECGFDRLAERQDDILRLCESAHVPVVWATGVLDSLARRGHPTRAEITDAAMAQRAECVMLGKGHHIVRALGTLDRILSRIEPREYKHERLLDTMRFGSRQNADGRPASS